MPFTPSNSEGFGKKGGSARSTAKKKAARQNGKRGGRPPSRTLAERLLGRKLTPYWRGELGKALSANEILFQSQIRKIGDFFGTSLSSSDGFDTKHWCRKSGRLPPEIRYLVKRFRLGANYYIAQLEAKAAKDYVAVSRLPNKQRVEEWDRTHNSFNDPKQPPPRRGKKYFCNLPDYRSLEQEFKENPNMTAQHIEKRGGPKYAGLGEAILACLSRPKKVPDYFRVCYPPLPQRAARWKQTHSAGEKCPGRWRRIKFHDLPNYPKVVQAFKSNPNMTPDELMAIQPIGFADAGTFLAHLRKALRVK
jgi:hypothetical protein